MNWRTARPDWRVVPPAWRVANPVWRAAPVVWRVEIPVWRSSFSDWRVVAPGWRACRADWRTLPAVWRAAPAGWRAVIPSDELSEQRQSAREPQLPQARLAHTVFFGAQLNAELKRQPRRSGPAAAWSHRTPPC